MKLLICIAVCSVVLSGCGESKSSCMQSVDAWNVAAMKQNEKGYQDALEKVKGMKLGPQELSNANVNLLQAFMNENDETKRIYLAKIAVCR